MKSKLLTLPFSIESILAKDNANQHHSTPTFSLSGSFSSSTNTSSDSPTSPNSQPLETIPNKPVKMEHDSASTGSPDSKLLHTPDKSMERFSGDFSPLWNDLLSRQLRFQGVNLPQLSAYMGYCEAQQNEKSKSLQQSSSSSTAGRSPRVPFSRHQVMVLECKFRQTHYLSSLEVTELANQLHLTETRVKIWFQNRRARERRENALNNLSSPMDHSPETLLVPGPDSCNRSISPMPPPSQWTPLLLQACLAAQNQFTDSEAPFPGQDPPILKLDANLKMT
ncbi:hypothetical protein Ciccas_011641 [Cichlidogyrus casuarinus]|uniref:Homeobox domain-containing protein n=1 Tax=Cichlidogyrus casuarinus TaxID=1844966 RepID=A0ABD2PSU4_9PLAT